MQLKPLWYQRLFIFYSVLFWSKVWLVPIFKTDWSNDRSRWPVSAEKWWNHTHDALTSTGHRPDTFGSDRCLIDLHLKKLRPRKTIAEQKSVMWSSYGVFGVRLFSRLIKQATIPSMWRHFNSSFQDRNRCHSRKISLLAALNIVILTTFGADIEEDFVKMTFPFQCSLSRWDNGRR